MQPPWTQVSVSPKASFLYLTSHPLTAPSRNKVELLLSISVTLPLPKSKPPVSPSWTAEVASLVPCFHSCWPPAYSPHRNQGKPLEMYHVMLILCLNLLVGSYLTHYAKHFPQGSLPWLMLWTSVKCPGFFLCIYKNTYIYTHTHKFYLSKMK